MKPEDIRAILGVAKNGLKSRGTVLQLAVEASESQRKKDTIIIRRIKGDRSANNSALKHVEKAIALLKKPQKSRK